jgi:hypothetical protein
VALRLTTLAWAALVLLSTERFGSDFSQGLVAQALTLLHISVSPRTFHILDTLLHKIAHLTEYGILAFFVYGSFGGSKRLGGGRVKRYGASVLLASIPLLTSSIRGTYPAAMLPWSIAELMLPEPRLL